MNKRMRMKRRQAERKKLHKILDLAMEKNAGTPAVFFEFHGHINKLEVGICKNGWKPGRSADVRHVIYLNAKYTPSTVDRVITELEAL